MVLKYETVTIMLGFLGCESYDLHWVNPSPFS
jgi:hypothetical protein